VSKLADFIERHFDELLEKWLVRAAAARPTGGYDKEELADHMPAFVRELIGALRAPLGDAARAQPPGREHGAQRFRLGFDLNSVLREYALLTHTLLALLETEHCDVSIRDVGICSDQVTSATTAAATEYVRRVTTRAAERARSEGERLGHLFDQAPAIIGHVAGKTHVFTFANRAFQTLLGGRNPVGRTFAEALPVLADQPFEKLLDQVFATGEPFIAREMVARFEAESEGERLFDFIYQPTRDETGAVDGVLIHAVEVTAAARDRREAQRAQQELFDERQKLAQIFRQSPAAMVLWRGPDLVFELVNTEYQAIFGNRELVGRPLLEALPELANQPFPALLRRVLETGAPFVGRELPALLARTEGGPLEERFYDFTYLRVHDAHGKPYGVYDHAVDVTERVLARRKTEELVQALQARTEFEQHLLGIVSHDLRNPISAILMGAAALLQSEDESERTTRIARRIHSSAERSGRMIRDLLDFTQARLGVGIPLQKKPADLYGLASAVLDELEAVAADRQMTLVRTGDAQGFWDGDRLSQVLANLLSNAIKYSPPRSPIEIRIAGGHTDVEVSVHNQGEPITPERMARIFEPMQRASDQIDRNDRSVGLGLYIVDAIVRTHGGTVGVRSDETGTTFTVRLPRK
jgi:signal transduction histidine kinase